MLKWSNEIIKSFIKENSECHLFPKYVSGEDNNIQLTRIPYWNIKNIPEILK